MNFFNIIENFFNYRKSLKFKSPGDKLTAKERIINYFKWRKLRSHIKDISKVAYEFIDKKSINSVSFDEIVDIAKEVKNLDIIFNATEKELDFSNTVFIGNDITVRLAGSTILIDTLNKSSTIKIHTKANPIHKEFVFDLYFNGHSLPVNTKNIFLNARYPCKTTEDCIGYFYIISDIINHVSGYNDYLHDAYETNIEWYANTVATFCLRFYFKEIIKRYSNKYLYYIFKTYIGGGNEWIMSLYPISKQ